ncbi:hypothetical protein Tco_0962411 [Tanacetum coccineum]
MFTACQFTPLELGSILLDFPKSSPPCLIRYALDVASCDHVGNFCLNEASGIDVPANRAESIFIMNVDSLVLMMSGISEKDEELPPLNLCKTQNDCCHLRHDLCNTDVRRHCWTDLHNGYVVPYTLGLLRRYQAHINVEYCNKDGSMKYVFKYINKGPDRVTATIDGEEVNEIKDYLNCTYLSSCEAAWCIYGFDIHYRNPSIERIPFHLKDEQQVIFDAIESIDYAVDKSSVNEIKFESWMQLN